ncbi:MAG: hypothetical protein ABJG88_12035 [Litorimonas sp.]
MPISRSIKAFIFAGFYAVLIACQASSQNAQDRFFESISAHCGKAFAGKLVSTDAVDAEFATKKLIMHVRGCEDDTLRIPFHVDDDRSRTWVLSKTKTGLRLKHDHRHEDGSEDAVTQYGGDSAKGGTAKLQNFPVDMFSIDMFKTEGLSASVVNVWSIEIDDATFTYQMSRPNRAFRVEFDLSQPIADTPPAPWGT